MGSNLKIERNILRNEEYLKAASFCTYLSICALVSCLAGCSHPLNCGAGGNCAPSYSSPRRSEASPSCAQKSVRIIRLYRGAVRVWSLQRFDLHCWGDVAPSALREFNLTREHAQSDRPVCQVLHEQVRLQPAALQKVSTCVLISTGN